MVYIPYNKGGYFLGFKVIFYETRSGKRPAEEFILTLDIKLKQK